MIYHFIGRADIEASISSCQKCDGQGSLSTLECCGGYVMASNGEPDCCGCPSDGTVPCDHCEPLIATLKTADQPTPRIET